MLSTSFFSPATRLEIFTYGGEARHRHQARDAGRGVGGEAQHAGPTTGVKMFAASNSEWGKRNKTQSPPDAFFRKLPFLSCANLRKSLLPLGPGEGSLAWGGHERT